MARAPIKPQPAPATTSDPLQQIHGRLKELEDRSRLSTDTDVLSGSIDGHFNALSGTLNSAIQAVIAGSGLTSVSHDTTLTGLGTSGSPLSASPAVTTAETYADGVAASAIVTADAFATAAVLVLSGTVAATDVWLSGTVNSAIVALSGTTNSAVASLSGTLNARFVNLSGTVDGHFNALSGTLNSAIQAVTTSTHRLYLDLTASPYNVIPNVRNTQAALNTVAIKQALTDYHSTPVTLLFPSGTTYVDRDLTVNSHASIVLTGSATQAPKRFMGHGMGISTIQAEGSGNSGEWDLIRASNGFRGLVVSDINLQFGPIALPDSSHQHHCLMLANQSGTTQQSIRHVEVHNVGFGNCQGAGFRTLGENNDNWIVEDVRVHHCDFETSGSIVPTSGSRSCIEIQRGFRNIEISNCFLRGAKNSVIDCEETTAATEDGLWIHHNFIDCSLSRVDTGVSLGGSGATALGTRCRFTDNTVLNGVLGCLSADSWEISRNRFVLTGTNADNSGFDTPSVLFLQTNTNLQFHDNYIERAPQFSGSFCLYLEASAAVSQSFIDIRGNTFLQATVANFLQVENADRLNIEGNTFQYSAASGSVNTVINVRALAKDANVISVVNNTLDSTTGPLKSLVTVTPGGGGVGPMHTDGITITGNRCNGMVTNGVLFALSAVDGSSHDPYPIIQGNDFDGADNVWFATGAATGTIFPIVAGNRAKNGHRHMVGTVAPEALVTGSVGNLYTFVSGSGTTTSGSLYMKTAGSGSTGWTVIASRETP